LCFIIAVKLKGMKFCFLILSLFILFGCSDEKTIAYEVQASKLYVRNEPSRQAKKCDSLVLGEIVNAQKFDSKWVKTTNSVGNTLVYRYISSEYLNPLGAPTWAKIKDINPLILIIWLLLCIAATVVQGKKDGRFSTGHRPNKYNFILGVIIFFITLSLFLLLKYCIYYIGYLLI